MRLLKYIRENNYNSEMEDHFVMRTNHHILLVKKYLGLILGLRDDRINNELLMEEMDHDQSKFEEPERTPYIHVNWSYHMKDQGKKYEVSDSLKNDMNNATFHHVKSNKHHPEYWDKNSDNNVINREDRDAIPEKNVDATEMPTTYVASMVADWMAMSEEKNTNPYDWARKNINVRWKFNNEQIALIYDLLNSIWRR